MVEEGAVVVDRRRRGRVKEVRGDGTAIRRGGLCGVLAKERRPEAARLVVLRLIAREAELDGRRLWKVEHVDHVHVRRRRGVEGQVRREAADRVPPVANKRLKAVGRALHRGDLRAEVADDRRREAHAEGEDLAVDIEAGERGNEGGDLRGEGRSGREVDGDEAEDRRGEVRAEGDLADRRLRTERMRVCTQPRVPLLVSTIPPRGVEGEGRERGGREGVEALVEAAEEVELLVEVDRDRAALEADMERLALRRRRRLDADVKAEGDTREGADGELAGALAAEGRLAAAGDRLAERARLLEGEGRLRADEAVVVARGVGRGGELDGGKLVAMARGLELARRGVDVDRVAGREVRAAAEGERRRQGRVRRAHVDRERLEGGAAKGDHRVRDEAAEREEEQDAGAAQGLAEGAKRGGARGLARRALEVRRRDCSLHMLMRIAKTCQIRLDDAKTRRRKFAQ